MILFVGGVRGLINGFVITKLKFSPFIATFAMLNVTKGFALVFAEEITVSGFPSDFKVISWGKVFGIVPIPIVIVLVFFMAGWFLLKKTIYGRRLYAIGRDRTAALVMGIKVDSVIIAAPCSVVY